MSRIQKEIDCAILIRYAFEQSRRTNQRARMSERQRVQNVTNPSNWAKKNYVTIAKYHTIVYSGISISSLKNFQINPAIWSIEPLWDCLEAKIGSKIWNLLILKIPKVLNRECLKRLKSLEHLKTIKPWIFERARKSWILEYLWSIRISNYSNTYEILRILIIRMPIKYSEIKLFEYL